MPVPLSSACDSQKLTNSNSDFDGFGNQFMNMAIDKAYDGMKSGQGGPFGATIVSGTKVISVAHNTVLGDFNPTRHAEMNAVRLACKALGTSDLSNCTLFTTCEPCPMCWGAIFRAGLSNSTYIGADKIDADTVGFGDAIFHYELLHKSSELLGQQIKTAHPRPNILKIQRLSSEAISSKLPLFTTGSPTCAIVDSEDKLLSSGSSDTESCRLDATANFVTEAVETATTNQKSHHLKGYKLYTSQMPDVTGMGALLWAQIEEIYVLSDDTALQVPKGTRTMFNAFATYHESEKCPWKKILSKQATRMMQSFNEMNGQLY